MDSFKPLVRFAGFEGEWEIERFGDIIEECFDKSTIENEDTLLSSSISGMYLNSELFGHQRGQSNIGYRKVRKNMLVLSAQNLHLGNANVNLRFDHGLVSPAYKIYDIIGANPEFMAHWIKREQTKDFFLNATTEGASLCRKNIIWEDLYDQYLSLPSLPEQQKISEYFTEIDRAISLQTQKLSKLKQIKAASLQNMFPQEGHNVPAIRFHGFRGDWKRVKLGELFDIGNGRDYKHLNEGDVPVYGTGGLMTYVDSFLYEGETICIGRKGTIDKPQYHNGKIWTVDTLFYTKNFKNVIVLFLYYLTLTIDWSLYNAATGVPSLTSENIKKILVLVPDFTEQQAIANYFTKLDRKIDLETQKLAKLKQIKTACLSKMFV